MYITMITGVCEPVDDPKCHKINSWLDCDREQGFECSALDQDPGEKIILGRIPGYNIPATLRVLIGIYMNNFFQREGPGDNISLSLCINAWWDSIS